MNLFYVKIIQKIPNLHSQRTGYQYLLFHQNYVRATNQLFTSKTSRDFLRGRGGNRTSGNLKFSRKKTSFFFFFHDLSIYFYFILITNGGTKTYLDTNIILLIGYYDLNKIHNG